MREVSERGVSVGDDYAGVAADVAEGFVVRAGDYVAAVAAHEAELWSSGGEGGERGFVEGVGVS